MNLTPLIVGLLPLATASAQLSPHLDNEVRSGVIESVDAHVREALGAEGAVGLTVAVSVGADVLLSAGYGIAELEHGVSTDAQTMFRIGSITKQFTAAAICRLAERDQLFIDDPLAQYLPDFDTGGKEVTIRQLLTHTSGIPSYTNLGEKWRRVVPLELTHEELLALQAGLPLEFEPGERYEYSNTGYYLLGMIIEKVSGLSYSEFLQKEFFGPLGLTRTRYGSNGDLILNRAQGYRHLGAGEFANDLLIGMDQPFAAGSLLSTGEDLLRWQMALVSGKVVRPETYEEMTLPFLLNGGGESPYGFGLGLTSVGGQSCISHGGGIFGFNSMLMYFPESRLGVAIASNSEGLDAGQVANGIALLMLAELN